MGGLTIFSESLINVGFFFRPFKVQQKDVETTVSTIIISFIKQPDIPRGRGIGCNFDHVKSAIAGGFCL